MNIQILVDEKTSQWANEAEINARRAKAKGSEAKLIEYPTGLQMMRFAEPFKEYGMHYEVTPEVWEAINVK